MQKGDLSDGVKYCNCNFCRRGRGGGGLQEAPQLTRWGLGSGLSRGERTAGSGTPVERKVGTQYLVHRRKYYALTMRPHTNCPRDISTQTIRPSREPPAVTTCPCDILTPFYDPSTSRNSSCYIIKNIKFYVFFKKCR